MNNYTKLAYCGLYCGGCRNFKENMNCMGCRDEKEMVSDCPTRACAIKRGFLHCGQCDDFPCKPLSDFYNDGVRHHAMALENIKRIIEIGVDEWLSAQEKEYICQCGKRRLWFATTCIHEKK